MMDTFVQSEAETVSRVWTLVLSKGRVQLLGDPGRCGEIILAQYFFEKMTLSFSYDYLGDTGILGGNI